MSKQNPSVYMISLIQGVTRKPASSELLANFMLSRGDVDGLLYIGYPILYAGLENFTVDALWLSQAHGVVVFDLVETIHELNNVGARQDRIFSLFDSLFRAYPELKSSRKDLAVQIEVVSFGSGLPPANEDSPLFANDNASLERILSNLPVWNNPELFDRTASIIQSVINLKTRNRRTNVTREDSRGSKIRNLETTVATLDRNQEKAVIEFFNGVQRIRGLAGSGKTIVLALKAAYLHTQFPDWEIAVTFNTRSLKAQFKTLIERFCIEKKREAPDWTKIHIVNAWGSPRDATLEAGVYYDFCITHGLEYLDFGKASTLQAKSPSDTRTAIDFVSHKAINEVVSNFEKYDAILVDEAQDLSESFLQLCHKFLKQPKRLIYAYDELQKLNEGTPLRNPREFLLDENDPFDDKILRVCYRNSRPVLVTAHGLGFGIYRANGDEKSELVQFFDQPQLWNELGYSVIEGQLQPGSSVTLARTPETSPTYLENHSSLDDLIVFQSFTSKEEQANWVANAIQANLEHDELLRNDIIVINPIALVTKKEVAMIRTKLSEKSIDNHIAGEFNADVFQLHESVTFTGINRAKGNEVPMVYIINAQDCYEGILNTNLDLIRRRNILFTAITRSKAWVRVLGVGPRMRSLIREYGRIKQADFTLKFEYPSVEQIARLNLIHRDVSDQQRQRLQLENEGLTLVNKVVENIRRGDAFLEDYPAAMQALLQKLLDE